MAVAAIAAAPAARAHATTTTQRIARGVSLERIRERVAGGAVMRAYVLRVDLGDPAVHSEALFPGRVAAVQRLSAMARRAGAIAAINGDFFNIRATNAPVGGMVTGGQLIKAPQRHRTRVAGVGVDGVGRIAAVHLQGSVELPSGPRPLVDLNDANPGFPPLIAPNGIGLFTPAWGSWSRAGAVRGQRDVAEVTLRDGRVVSVRSAAGSGPIAQGTAVLLGAGRGARSLARLHRDDRIGVGFGQKTTAPVDFRWAIGAKYVLVRDGAVRRDLPPAAPAPRSAVGFTAGGHEMELVAVDGRARGVPGLTIAEFARLVRRTGARDAALLDDGGSTTIVARLRGGNAPAILNRPSDGRERPVANGIGVFVAG